MRMRRHQTGSNSSQGGGVSSGGDGGGTFPVTIGGSSGGGEDPIDPITNHHGSSGLAWNLRRLFSLVCGTVLLLLCVAVYVDRYVITDREEFLGALMGDDYAPLSWVPTSRSSGPKPKDFKNKLQEIDLSVEELERKPSKTRRGLPKGGVLPKLAYDSSAKSWKKTPKVLDNKCPTNKDLSPEEILARPKWLQRIGVGQRARKGTPVYTADMYPLPPPAKAYPSLVATGRGGGEEAASSLKTQLYGEALEGLMELYDATLANLKQNYKQEDTLKKRKARSFEKFIDDDEIVGSQSTVPESGTGKKLFAGQPHQPYIQSVSPVFSKFKTRDQVHDFYKSLLTEEKYSYVAAVFKSLLLHKRYSTGGVAHADTHQQHSEGGADGEAKDKEGEEEYQQHPMTIPVWTTPLFMDYDELKEMCKGIDVPVAQFVFVWNGNMEGMREALYPLRFFPTAPYGIEIVEYPVINAGFAASTNAGILRGIELAQKQNKPLPTWTFASNADVTYAPKQLGRLSYNANMYWPEYGLIYSSVQEHFAFGISLAAVKKIGLLDEVFYPAYMEDIDYRWRIRLCGLGQLLTGAEFVHAKNANMKKKNPLASEYNAQRGRIYGGFMYGRFKWGHYIQEDIYDDAPPSGWRNPFNVPTAPLSLWAVDPVHRQCVVSGFGPYRGTSHLCWYNGSSVLREYLGKTTPLPVTVIDKDWTGNEPLF